MSAIWILPLIALLSTVAMIFFIYTRAQRYMPPMVFIIMLFFFLGWSIGEFAQKYMGDDPEVFKWTLLCAIHGDMFPAVFLVFTLVYPLQNERFMRNFWPLMFIIFVPKVLTTTVTLLSVDTVPPDGWTDDLHYGYYPYILMLQHQVSPLGDWYFYFALAHSFALIAIGAMVLVSNALGSETDEVRHKTRIILIGLITYVTIGASTTFMLPLMGYYPPELISLGNLLMNLIIAYGLLLGTILLFSPQTETEPTRDYAQTLELGQYYLSSVDQGIKSFNELVNAGFEGLYVGAVKPNLDITKFKRTPIVILTEAGKGLRQYGNLQYVPADEFKIFKASIFTFIKSANRGVIFLDNMDVILEKGWTSPREFVEFGVQMRDAPMMNAIWIFGSPLLEGESIEKVRSVMDFPVVKKGVLLDKLNSILDKAGGVSTDIEDQLKRLGRVEPIFYYIVQRNGRLVFNDDITEFPGIVGFDPTTAIRLFVQQVQSKLSMDVYRGILEDLKEYGISRFEFLLRTGDSYLVEEAFHDRGRVYDVFLDLMDRGFDGICITRTEPNKLRQRYLLPRETEIFWLTQDRKEDHDIKPAPEYLMVHIKNFIETHRNEPGVLLLDGLEYLITFQGDQFESYLKVMRRISDLISQSKVILLIPYDPEALPAERIAIFRRSGIEVITRDMLA
jgi:hypothetical protein